MRAVFDAAADPLRQLQPGEKEHLPGWDGVGLVEQGRKRTDDRSGEAAVLRKGFR